MCGEWWVQWYECNGPIRGVINHSGDKLTAQRRLICMQYPDNRAICILTGQYVCNIPTTGNMYPDNRTIRMQYPDNGQYVSWQQDDTYAISRQWAICILTTGQYVCNIPTTGRTTAYRNIYANVNIWYGILYHMCINMLCDVYEYRNITYVMLGFRRPRSDWIYNNPLSDGI